MAKDKEKQIAFHLFVDKNLTAKQIADHPQVQVRHNTVCNWIKEGNWKKIRNAQISQSSERLERIQAVIDGLSNERLAILKEIKETKELLRDELDADLKKVAEKSLADLNSSAVRIDNGIAMWNKTLLSFHKENRISLSVYIEIQNKIFEALRAYDEAIYMKTLDFQQAHILEVSEQLN
ncbi:hypothetical protein [Ornithobacterium rhinotracheale]|uniref:DUF1804 family protein n=1 Tax=Ornithobacterium rhinotracheale (strain ATCC 51463 / DSM 15997 / CCUG 23171 / CIP 104009 / LMG 9086) TaxID=867902 RepID=I4A347_ORNRL|nr:hypothetical protein [Ornithobacterium rhinotracheale]AFL98381.1 hypothetical protein Ornrh_2250 [Ornithobacterium rhinotracheale DSM 15997]AIQ00744.1 hypothetical protein Q785_11395 [Ornithobacterium rhinotracheale ORT-UMN 88]KGB65829.1 hypothetical protein Q787_10920 [Ornithobacterium rhinotracheale H06-030791]MBN3662823.1 hypothetical protein [Ornithobacterium rhinotracheale]MCK0193271.1 hypothetical protein [Ornithobacterium rhinotracheale]